MTKAIITFLSFYIVGLSLYGQTPHFERTILRSKLADPWSIVYGADDHLWITESKTYRVLRIDPETKDMKVVLDLSMAREFPRYDTLDLDDKPWPQGGLMGMVLHPKFTEGSPYVYLAYIYKHLSGNDFMSKLSRFRYDEHTNLLRDEEVIDQEIPGSNDHNGGRLEWTQQNGKYFLFYALGDMGAGQYSNVGRENHAQDLNRKEGKILRYSLDFATNSPLHGSPVYSFGHRNPQGLSWAKSANFSYLYSCEHGPMSDDEINLIEQGKNYGHPLIVGYADGNYNGLAAAVSDDKKIQGEWNTMLPLIEDEAATATLWGTEYRDPLYSFMPTGNDSLRVKMEKIRSGENQDWQSIAPSSLIYYNHRGIPAWQNSLLVTSLKQGAVYRITLTADGRGVQGDPERLFAADVRYRDICLSPDGRRIYLITDRSAVTSGPTEENPDHADLRGCLIEYRLKPM